MGDRGAKSSSRECGILLALSHRPFPLGSCPLLSIRAHCSLWVFALMPNRISTGSPTLTAYLEMEMSSILRYGASVVHGSESRKQMGCYGSSVSVHLENWNKLNDSDKIL